jgi:DNA-binding NtrC family response regulator
VTHILLIEDDRDVRPLMEHILRTQGFHVTTSGTVAGALAELDAQFFDLVLADVHLPDGSGLSVADRATALGMRVLVVTSYGLGLAPGALAGYDYLLKPVRRGELLDELRRRLREEWRPERPAARGEHDSIHRP